MRYYYITKRIQKIGIPFTPKFSLMSDRYKILNEIFGDRIDPKYESLCSIIVDAIKYQEPAYWEDASDKILALNLDKSSLWAEHFLKISVYLRNRGNKRYKSPVTIIPEDSVVKFRRLLKGYV